MHKDPQTTIQSEEKGTGDDVKHHSIEIWWSGTYSWSFTKHEAVIILWHVSHQARPCGIPAKWIGPLWRSQSSCAMNTDEGCCWHCENQRQHTRLPQTTPRPRTTALHGPPYTTTCSRWEEHGTGLWLRERETDRHGEKDECVQLMFLDMVYHVIFIPCYCSFGSVICF